MRWESGSGDSVCRRREIHLLSNIFIGSESGVALRLPPHSMTPRAGDIYGSLKISVLRKYLRAAHAAVETIHFDGAQFRRDIEVKAI